MPALPLLSHPGETEILSTSHPLYLHQNTFAKRQQLGGIVAIPSVYSGLNDGPDPGAIVGITLGSVAGFLLVSWLLVGLVSGFGSSSGGSIVGEEEVIVRRSRSHRSRRSEMREVSRSPRAQRIVVEERTARTVPVVVDGGSGRRVDGDDIVEVIEEHTPPRRKKGHRSSGYRSVDPNAYAGGGYPQHSIRR